MKSSSAASPGSAGGTAAARTSAVPAEVPRADVRLIAFYLPQYHPIPENDAWWGRGFTEWTSVAKARPRFRGHYQPHLPADLGFYDLRLPEARAAQAELARQYGIHGFCYYHYWFHGRRLLERPFREVLASGQPDFPFCLCWANESWTRAWDGRSGTVLMEQTYSPEDDLRHIEWLLEAFADPRYIRIGGRPLMMVYRTGRLPEPRRTADAWREAARRRGMADICLCTVESFSDERVDPHQLGFDAAVEFQPDWLRLGRPLRRPLASLSRFQPSRLRRADPRDRVYHYATVMENMLRKPPPSYRRYPCVTPSWDNSARREAGALILDQSTPELFQSWLTAAVRGELAQADGDRVVFINAWNEWAEGNHLEPDQRHGRAYLEATARALRTVASRSVRGAPQGPA